MTPPTARSHMAVGGAAGPLHAEAHTPDRTQNGGMVGPTGSSARVARWSDGPLVGRGELMDELVAAAGRGVARRRLDRRAHRRGGHRQDERRPSAGATGSGSVRDLLGHVRRRSERPAVLALARAGRHSNRQTLLLAADQAIGAPRFERLTALRDQLRSSGARTPAAPRDRRPPMGRRGVGASPCSPRSRRSLMHHFSSSPRCAPGSRSRRSSTTPSRSVRRTSPCAASAGARRTATSRR